MIQQIPSIIILVWVIIIALAVSWVLAFLFDWLEDAPNDETISERTWRKYAGGDK